MTNALFITPIYAALCGVILLVLSVRTLLLRRAAGIGIGSTRSGVENLKLARAIRAHGNFIEYAPMVLILMAMHEFRSGPVTALWVFGSMLILARVVHALGISREPENLKLRVVGMVLTLSCIAGLAWRVLYTYF